MVKYSRYEKEKQDAKVKDMLTDSKPFIEVKDKKMVNRIKEKLDHLEDYIPMDELEEDKKRLERAKAYVIEERKWINEVVSRVDIVPDEGNYYDQLAVKPGFNFW